MKLDLVEFVQKLVTLPVDNGPNITGKALGLKETFNVTTNQLFIGGYYPIPCNYKRPNIKSERVHRSSESQFFVAPS